jgi:hypothetical protein
MGLASSLTSKFKSRCQWSDADWDREWLLWLGGMLDATVGAFVATGQTDFTPDEWRVLNTIYATSEACRADNNMIGYRDALGRHLTAANYFISLRKKSAA